MTRRYLPAVRQRAIDLVRSGLPVVQVAVSEALCRGLVRDVRPSYRRSSPGGSRLYLPGGARRGAASTEVLRRGRRGAALWSSGPAPVHQQPWAQPGVAALEREVGGRLLERSPRQVALTEAGLALLPAARDILSRSDKTLQQLRDHHCGVTGQLRVGLHDEGAAELTGPIIRRFRAAHPGVQVTVRAMPDYIGMAPALHDGVIDVLVGWPAFADPGRCQVTVLYADPRVVLLPAHHRLADAPSVSIADLLDEPFVDGTGVPAAVRLRAPGSPSLAQMASRAIDGGQRGQPAGAGGR